MYILILHVYQIQNEVQRWHKCVSFTSKWQCGDTNSPTLEENDHAFCSLSTDVTLTVCMLLSICRNKTKKTLWKLLWNINVQKLHNFIEKMHMYTLGCQAKNILGFTSLYPANILSNCFSILFFCIAIFSLTYVLSIKETHSNMATNNINSWNHTVNILLNNINKYSVT